MNSLADQNAVKKQRSLIRAQNRKRIRSDIRYYRKLYPMMLFGIIFFAVFSYAPMYGIQLAFKHYNVGNGISGSDWVGLKNFQIIFARAEFWNVVKNTVVLSVLKLIFAFPVPILLAIGLNEIVSNKLRRFLQVIFTLPPFFILGYSRWYHDSFICYEWCN